METIMFCQGFPNRHRNLTQEYFDSPYHWFISSYFSVLKIPDKCVLIINITWFPLVILGYSFIFPSEIFFIPFHFFHFSFISSLDNIVERWIDPITINYLHPLHPQKIFFATFFLCSMLFFTFFFLFLLLICFNNNNNIDIIWKEKHVTRCVFVRFISKSCVCLYTPKDRVEKIRNPKYIRKVCLMQSLNVWECV